jgi:hypothetical protein
MRKRCANPAVAASKFWLILPGVKPDLREGWNLVMERQKISRLNNNTNNDTAQRTGCHRGRRTADAGRAPHPRHQLIEFMKTFSQLCAIALVGSFLLAAGSVRAAETKSYQVTGPVLEVTATKIVVQKGDEKWEIVRTPETKVTGDLKVGAKVTIYYTMTANEVDVKADKKK